MNKISISITLTNIAELEAVESALELFADMEADRLRDASGSSPGENINRARMIQKAAVRLLKEIREGR